MFPSWWTDQTPATTFQVEDPKTHESKLFKYVNVTSEEAPRRAADRIRKRNKDHNIFIYKQNIIGSRSFPLDTNEIENINIYMIIRREIESVQTRRSPSEIVASGSGVPFAIDPRNDHRFQPMLRFGEPGEDYHQDNITDLIMESRNLEFFRVTGSSDVEAQAL